MDVKFLNPGTNVIPNTLSSNTIYVLNSGSYIYNYTNSDAISMADCTAILGSGDVTLYTQNAKDNMIYANADDNIIIDGITIDGINNGL